MKRTKLAERKLPRYTRGEEIANMVTHIVGGTMGIAVLTLCVIRAAIHHNPMGVVTSAIYGATMILLYTMSSIYHGLLPSTGKKVMQVIDHCTIYVAHRRNLHPHRSGEHCPQVSGSGLDAVRGWNGVLPLWPLPDRHRFEEVQRVFHDLLHRHGLGHHCLHSEGH